MKQYWEQACVKVDAMAVRERAMMFAALACLVIFAINSLLIDPLLIKQKALSAKIVQQQQQMREAEAAMQAMADAKHNDEHSPMRARIAELKAQLQESDGYLQSRRDRLVDPAKMGGLLEQVLKSHDKLNLVELKTLPLSLLIEPPAGKAPPSSASQVYKHGVQITVKGNYLDLLRYLAELEKLPAQMFWGEVSLSVAKHPEAVLTLTVYTLSLDKTWLTV